MVVENLLRRGAREYMNKEEWHDIAGFEGSYMVSSEGQIKSLGRCWKVKSGQLCIEDRILKPQKHYRGYLFVHLHHPTNGRTKFFVHRAVALAFLPNPENKEIVNHKDRNKQHNAAANLEWCTAHENTQHYVLLDKAAKDGDF